MTKKTKQTEVEQWEAAITELEAGRQGEIDKIEAVTAQMKAIQREDAEPTTVFKRTGRLMSLSADITAARTRQRLIEGQLESAREMLRAARAKVHEVEVSQLRGPEKQAYREIVAKAQELEKAMAALDEIRAQIVWNAGSPRVGIAQGVRQTVHYFADYSAKYDPFSQWID